MQAASHFLQGFLLLSAYFLAGIAWIISSFVLRLLYLVAFEYWDSDMIVQWNNNFQWEWNSFQCQSNFLIVRISGSTKQALIVLSIIGFIFLDLVYAASIINYAIQSELNVYLLKAIARLVDNKLYRDLDEAYKVNGSLCRLWSMPWSHDQCRKLTMQSATFECWMGRRPLELHWWFSTWAYLPLFVSR